MGSSTLLPCPDAPASQAGAILRIPGAWRRLENRSPGRLHHLHDDGVHSRSILERIYLLKRKGLNDELLPVFSASCEVLTETGNGRKPPSVSVQSLLSPTPPCARPVNATCEPATHVTADPSNRDT